MGIKVVATNRKATHNYKIIEKYESGIVLSGTEVKSIRNNKVSVKEAYVRIIRNELYVIGMNISDYENSGYSNHNPTSDRKLLMHKREIFSHTGFPGGQKRVNPIEMLKKDGTSLVRHAVKGMLPKNKLGAELFRNLKVYAGAEHGQEAQKPKAINLNDYK